ncbi:MAG: class I adenylate-forming enzyme family protein [Actinomycetes bacterium]
MTAVDAREAAGSVAERLLTLGIGPGDRVAVAPRHENDIDLAQEQQRALIAIVWGSLSVGIIPVMVNPDLSDRERAYILADCQPALVLDSTDRLSGISEPSTQPRSLPPFPLGRPMHYSSGTTGTPKGVWSGVLTPGQAEGLWGTEIALWGCTEADTSLVHGPLAHSGPLRFALYTLLAGGDVLLPGWFDADRHARAIAEQRPTTAFVVPSHMQRLLELPGGLAPSSYRMLVHAGAACPPVIKQGIHDWAGAENVWEFYGSTEGQFTTMPGTEWAARPGSVGRARADREIRVIDGVIWCAAPEYGYFEYWREPEKTANAWQDIDGRRWFTVGDLGRLDDEGYLYIDGRRDDLIISGGMNVYPAEIEAEILRYDGVTDVAVFGVADEQWGQRVCAAVVGDVDTEALSAWLRTDLAGYKRPKQVYCVDELPRTASGKVQRLRVAGLLGLE